MLMDEQNHFISDDDLTKTDSQPLGLSQDSITWSASEFVDNSKNVSWYALFLVSILAISALIYFFTRNIFSSIVIFILGIVMSYVASRKPKVMSYSLDSKGIVINGIVHLFSEFKSFNLVSEDGEDHISLISVKRFAPNKVIYFEPRDKNRITSLLGEFLPLENASDNRTEKFMKKIGL